MADDLSMHFWLLCSPTSLLPITVLLVFTTTSPDACLLQGYLGSFAFGGPGDARYRVSLVDLCLLCLYNIEVASFPGDSATATRPPPSSTTIRIIAKKGRSGSRLILGRKPRRFCSLHIINGHDSHEKTVPHIQHALSSAETDSRCPPGPLRPGSAH